MKDIRNLLFLVGIGIYEVGISLAQFSIGEGGNTSLCHFIRRVFWKKYFRDTIVGILITYYDYLPTGIFIIDSVGKMLVEEC